MRISASPLGVEASRQIPDILRGTLSGFPPVVGMLLDAAAKHNDAACQARAWYPLGDRGAAVARVGRRWRRIVDKFPAYRRWADPLLKQEDALAEAGTRRKLYLSLALLPVDESKVNYLRDQLLVVSPTRFPMVRDALLPYASAIIEPLWSIALDSTRDVQQRFQAGCALATYAPDDNRWARIGKLVATHLVTLHASDLVLWPEVLRPAKQQLIEPLAVIYRDASQEQRQRSFATEVLADYLSDQPEPLVNLLADAEQFQFPVIFAKLTSQQDEAIPLAEAELPKRAADDASESEKERLAKRQSNLAVALLRMGKSDAVWPLLRFSPDPRVRSYLIQRMSQLGNDPWDVMKRLDVETDVTIRRALYLTLGEFIDPQLSVAQRRLLIEKLLVVYESEPDAGLHAAVEWLLRKWGHAERLQAIVEKLRVKEDLLQARKPANKQQWYVNSQGQTFVILDAGEFLIGSPELEPGHQSDEVRHRCQIGRRIAISSTHVTKAQFAQCQAARPEIKKRDTAKYVTTDDSPQTDMTWYEAAHYCNWLSEQEGIAKERWCYEPNEKSEYGPGMKAKDNYLQLSGYRLPTEAEWEYACRAGTVTSRYYGLTESLLAQYAWYETNSRNRTWPVGSVKPNDFGLFDTLGNAWQWCDDPYLDYPEAADAISKDVGSTKPVIDSNTRVLRGGAF